MRIPAGLVTLPLLAGVVLGLLAADRGQLDLRSAAASAAALALMSAVGAFCLTDRAVTVAGASVGCALVGFSLAVTSAGETYQPPLMRWFAARAPAAALEAAVVEGVLREDASWSGTAALLVLDVDRIGAFPAPQGLEALPASGGVRVTVGGELAAGRLAEWRAGRRIRAPVFLRLPTVYLDPGVRDDRRALARRGIVLVGTAKSAMLVAVERHGSVVAESAAGVRAWVRRTLAYLVGRWSARSAAIAIAVLIGDRTGLPDADTRRLQDAGTYHVIAISGGNIAILTMMLLGLGALAGLPIRPAAILTILALLVYREVVISAPSVERAINAALLYLAARVIDHRGSALNVLAVAGAIGLAVSPVVVLDAGFLLSFGATLGILLAMAARSPPTRGASLVRRVASEIVLMLATTAAAEAALLPVSALLFGRVTLAGLALNLVAIPMMSVLQAASMFALAVSPASTAVAQASGFVAHLAATGILESARLAGLVPGLARDVASPAAWIVTSYYASAAGLLWGRSPRLRRVAGTAMSLAAGVILVGPVWAADVLAAPATGLRVVVLDVGQGDATVIVMPGGGAVLVDAGGVAAAMPLEAADGETGGFDIGQRVVAPALRALGVRRLEALTITHGDPDHLGGVPGVIRSFRPGSIWDGVPVPPHAPLRAVNDLADASRIPWRTMQAGDATRIGAVSIRVLHPPLPDWERQRVRNEDSVVLDVRIGDVSIVLPGDIGTEGERAIVPLLTPARTVILKAAHHGSATSSTPPLLDALRPAAAIFSAGRNNRFGHPAVPVVARYRERGVPMFSTADGGAVVIDTDGTEVTIWSWTDPGRRMTISGNRLVDPFFEPGRTGVAREP